MSSKFKVGDRVRVNGSNGMIEGVSRDGDKVFVRMDSGYGNSWCAAEDVTFLSRPAGVPLDVSFALVPGGRAPVRATEGAAAVDLHARCENDTPEHAAFGENTVPAASIGTWTALLSTACPVVRIPLGVRVAIPSGHVGLLFLRSSLGKRGLVMPNGVGVIDSDYRGEVSTLLQNLSGEDAVIRDGERIAQLIVLPLPAVSFVQVDDLEPTSRGDGGFGSTGTGEVTP